jgi:hypothetical protein
VRTTGSRGAVLLSLVLIVVGVALLLNTFLIVQDFNVAALLPLALVVAGGIVLLRGDLLSGGSGRGFGITRGSIESATLEVSSGAVDVIVRALPREGRLIAGQFAAESRPALQAEDAHAYLRFDRAATPFLAMSNWELSLARDLPWSIYATAHLGAFDFDLRGLIVQQGVIATGLGGIRFVCPSEAFGPITLRSAVGDIRVLVPESYSARIRVKAGRLARIVADSARFTVEAPGLYVCMGTQPATPIELELVTTFGDLYLA